jgi:acetyltransferase-like isoleucine patch superfamily enzyme
MNQSIGDNTEITGSLEIREEGGTIIVGRDCLIEGYIVCENFESRIVIGNNVYVGGSTVIDCAGAISIEDDVLISYHVVISDTDGHSKRLSRRRHDLKAFRNGKIDWNQIPIENVAIRQGVWVGTRSIVLKGVDIGEGAIVAAGSVVTQDVPPWHMVAGNPARIVRKLGKSER